MLFHSPVFLFWFLPLVLLGYWVFRAQRVPFLLVASYLFYAWWSPVFLPLLLFSTVMNFVVGKAIAVSHKKIWLITGILLNLFLLGFFKYQGMLPDGPLFSVGLPLAISFFTFEGISYLMDVYRGAAPAKNLTQFACFLSFFPHLIAGPIIRFPAMSPQFAEDAHPWSERAEGMYRFCLGLAKKVLLADVLAGIADPIFADPASTAHAWLGLFAYTMQIYLDFSSYTDMAIGIGLFFGFRLPENFETPYFSKSITEFWRRWHITLSSWFRDYLYFPLGGSRRSMPRVMLNLIIVMALAGLWHGANWTFVLWGFYYGLLLAIERAFLFEWLKKTPLIVQNLWTFFLVMMGWVLFRSTSIAGALDYFATLFSFSSGTTPALSSIMIVAAGVFLLLLEPWVPKQPKEYSRGLAVGFAILTLFTVFIALGNESSPFIYFQF